MTNADALETRFTLKRRDFTLDVDASLPASGITGIFGPSGSGKSTLLRCMAGLERAAEGAFRLDQIRFQGDGFFEPPHRRGIALIDQGIHLFPHMNVRRNLLFGLKRAPAERRRITFEEVVDSLDLTTILSRDVSTLSGGEARRVAIGRALLASPKLLLLDEPCIGLDAQRKREILPFLRRVVSEFSIPMIYVTHDLFEIVYLATHMATMSEGSIDACGVPAIVQTTLDPDAHAGVIGARLPATVTRFEPAAGAITVALKGGNRVIIPSPPRETGVSADLQVFARDVGLDTDGSTSQPGLTVLDGEISAMSVQTMTHVCIALKTDSGHLLALIDRLTCGRLNLGIGMSVRASIRHALIMS